MPSFTCAGSLVTGNHWSLQNSQPLQSLCEYWQTNVTDLQTTQILRANVKLHAENRNQQKRSGLKQGGFLLE